MKTWCIFTLLLALPLGQFNKIYLKAISSLNKISDSPLSCNLLDMDFTGEFPLMKVEFKNNTFLPIRVSRILNYGTTLTLTDIDGDVWNLSADQGQLLNISIEYEYSILLGPYKTVKAVIYMLGDWHIIPQNGQELARKKNNLSKSSLFSYSGIIYIGFSDLMFTSFQVLPLQINGKVFICLK